MYRLMVAAEPTTPADMSAMVAQAQGGDRDAMEAVLLALAPAISRFGLRMCRNADDAEDVLQDALLKVAQHLGEFEGRSSLNSWVFAVTRSACARKRRGLKNQRHQSDEHLVAVPDLAPSPEARAADHELAGALAAALARLSDEHREVITLRDIEGLSAAEVASALGISVDAVKSRLHRARGALRSAFLPGKAPSRGADQAACPDAAELWSKKLEGELTQGDCRAMEKHIATCAPCGAACDALKQVLASCRSARAAKVPFAIQARVKAAVRAWAG